MEIEGWSQTLTAGPLLLIAAAANRLIEIGGGFAVADSGTVTAELALPVACARPLRLGEGGGRLGYTGWIGQADGQGGDGYRRDARFQPAERLGRGGGQSVERAA